VPLLGVIASPNHKQRNDLKSRHIIAVYPHIVRKRYGRAQWRVHFQCRVHRLLGNLWCGRCRYDRPRNIYGSATEPTERCGAACSACIWNRSSTWSWGLPHYHQPQAPVTVVPNSGAAGYHQPQLSAPTASYSYSSSGYHHPQASASAVSHPIASVVYVEPVANYRSTPGAPQAGGRW
jgi:hypothetical protein